MKVSLFFEDTMPVSITMKFIRDHAATVTMTADNFESTVKQIRRAAIEHDIQDGKETKIESITESTKDVHHSPD